MPSKLSFVARLIQAVPELEPTHREHVEDNDGLLPHVFMGDVTRFVIAKSGDSSAHGVLRRIMLFIDDELEHEDPEALDLIPPSFIENLADNDDVISKIKPVMGPRLRAILESRS